MSNDQYNKKSKDVIVVPLTSNLRDTDYDVLITDKSMEKGSLIADSKAKTDKIFSIDKKLIITNIGRVNRQTFSKIKKMIVALIE